MHGDGCVDHVNMSTFWNDERMVWGALDFLRSCRFLADFVVYFILK